MKTDRQLLERYVSHGSESAFRELVERHIKVVYSAAIRESKGNASLAEDITQAVFTQLARSARKLIPHPTLAGWLYTCVRRVTANVRRAEASTDAGFAVSVSACAAGVTTSRPQKSC